MDMSEVPNGHPCNVHIASALSGYGSQPEEELTEDQISYINNFYDAFIED